MVARSTTKADGTPSRRIDFAGLAEIRPDDGVFMLRVPLQGSVAAEDARSLTTGARVRGLSSYVMSDARGSVLATTYLNVFPATFAREAEYDAWGKTLAGYSTLASPKHGFAGAEPDEAVGTYSFGARTYDPSLRRWVSPDPLLAGRPDIDEHLGEALNLYSYADGNPVKKTDKSGFWWPIAVAVAVGTVIGMGAAAPSDTSKAPADILGMALSVIGPPVVSRAIGTAVEKVVLATAEKVAPYLVPTVRAVTAVEKVAPAVAKGEAAGAKAAPAAAKAEAPAAAAKVTPAEVAKPDGKKFPSEQKALVDMAKADKKAGGVAGSVDTYKKLNAEAGKKGFAPPNAVRGPEAHPLRTPESTPGPGQNPHGHVGPVGHIPVKP